MLATPLLSHATGSRTIIQIVAATLLMLGGATSSKWAQSAILQVTPVRVEFDSSQRAQALNIVNSGSSDLDAQVRVMRWTQENGQERLVPADDMVVSPAIVRVSPGKQQIVRVVRMQPTPPAKELSYRVFVDELPSTSTSETGAGLKVLMRYSIPVFVAPLEAGAPAKSDKVPAASSTDLSSVHSQFVAGNDGLGVLRVRNDGLRALRISYLSTLGAGGERRMLGNGLIGYVLPGQQMSWPVNLPYPLPAGLIVKARFNEDRQARPLPMD